MKLKEKRYSFHLDITKSLIDYDGAKLKKVNITTNIFFVVYFLY